MCIYCLGVVVVLCCAGLVFVNQVTENREECNVKSSGLLPAPPPGSGDFSPSPPAGSWLFCHPGPHFEGYCVLTTATQSDKFRSLTVIVYQVRSIRHCKFQVHISYE